MGEAREWYRYFKMYNSDPPWIQFKEELLERFDIDSKDPVDEFKRIHQTGGVDEYAKKFERGNCRSNW
jgi:Retrotransposon gag protein